MPDGLEVALHHKFTEQQKAFVSGIVSGLNPPDAARLAGYGESNVAAIASVMLQQPHILAAVQVYAARELALGAPGAIKLLRRMVDEDDKWDPKVRLAAANSLLNRAGHIAPKATDPRDKGARTPLNEMDMDQLRAERDRLEQEIAGRAKEVSSANPAPSATQAIDDII